MFHQYWFMGYVIIISTASLDGYTEVEHHNARNLQTCKSTEYQCSNGNCINEIHVCNNEKDCIDGGDESPSLCRQRKFECTNKDAFKCNDGTCIPIAWKCDGIKECHDGSDEISCVNRHTRCSSVTEFDCGNGICIPVSKVCDKTPDCPNSSDEHDCPKYDCGHDNGGCSQLCVIEPNGPICQCRDGYKFKKGSSTICEDTNECDIPGSCSQKCINLVGSFKCECHDGYQLDLNNQTRCVAKRGRASLLVSRITAIQQVMLDNHAIKNISSNLNKASVLDFDFKTENVYWYNFKDKRIYKTSIEYYNRTSVISGEPISSDGIAVDWIYDHLYWTDWSKKTIELSNLDGTMRKVLIKDRIGQPRAIALNPLKGWMFWSDLETPAKIERASMDGSRREIIVEIFLKWPNGITLDFVEERLYWVDGGYQEISSCLYDGKDRREVISSSNYLQHPFSITVFEDWIYWSDWDHRMVFKANKFTEDNIEAVYSEDMDKTPMGIQIYHPYRQMNGTNHCKTLGRTCSHLCLPTPYDDLEPPKISCACPEGFNLLANGQTCMKKVSNTVKPISKCNEATEFDCGQGTCIPNSKVCDKIIDCPNSADENAMRCPKNECEINNGGCSHNCVNEPNGAMCTCNPGYALKDRTLCEDIDECNIPGSCSQKCINLIGSYKCECYQGYEKDPNDNTKCIMSKERASLLIGRATAILKINLGNENVKEVINDAKGISTFDYDFKTETIYWNSKKGFSIKRAGLRDRNRTSVVASDPPVHTEGIAVDWIYNHLYWTDLINQSIAVANLDGSWRKSLIHHRIEKPRAIAVNPIEGWMFWSDWGSPAKIERAGMDGSRREVIVDTSIIWPNGITLDYVQGRIYWVDAQLNVISSCFYDGRDRREVISSSDYLLHPFSITTFEDWVYWSDWQYKTVFKADKFTGANVEAVLTDRTELEPMEVKVYHSFRQNNGTNYCINLGKGCSHLCLPNPSESLRISCACPEGMHLMSNGQTCENIVTVAVEKKSDCRSLGRFNCGGGVCIPQSQVCDRISDCPNSSDESHCYKKECGADNGGCSHNCVDEPNGFICTCNKGFALKQGSETMCEDIDECAIPGSCSHKCINLLGHFQCQCNEGYKPNPDNPTKCIATQERPSLFVCGVSEIQKINLDDHKIKEVLVSSTGSDPVSASTIDYDFKNGMIYWNHINKSEIQKASIDDGKEVSVVIPHPPVITDGIAVDWIHNHLYWTDNANKTIQVSNLDGSMRKVLIKDLFKPRSIALNPNEGWMFWSDWGHSTIERAGMDGSMRKVIVDRSIVWPNGITLDFVQRKIYWVDGNLNQISSCFYDGSHRRDILHSTNYLLHPFSIATFEDWVYWSDWDHKMVFKANKFTGADIEAVITEEMKYQPNGIIVYHPYRQTDGINYCDTLGKRCSHLCLRAPNVGQGSPNITCACPDGFNMTDDGETCNVEGAIKLENGFSVAGIIVTAVLIIFITSGLIYLIFRNNLHRDAKILHFGSPRYKKGITNEENVITPENLLIPNTAENETWTRPNSNLEFNNPGISETVQLI